MAVTSWRRTFARSVNARFTYMIIARIRSRPSRSQSGTPLAAEVRRRSFNRVHDVRSRREINSARCAAWASAFHLTPVVLVGGNTLRSGGSNNNTACFHGPHVGMDLLLKEEKPLTSGGQRTPPSAFSPPQKRFTMSVGVLRSSLEAMDRVIRDLRGSDVSWMIVSLGRAFYRCCNMIYANLRSHHSCRSSPTGSC